MAGAFKNRVVVRRSRRRRVVRGAAFELLLGPPPPRSELSAPSIHVRLAHIIYVMTKIDRGGASGSSQGGLLIRSIEFQTRTEPTDACVKSLGDALVVGDMVVEAG